MAEQEIEIPVQGGGTVRGRYKVWGGMIVVMSEKGFSRSVDLQALGAGDPEPLAEKLLRELAQEGKA